VKTGTSSDYRDAWAVGFNDKYTVGVWLGIPDEREYFEFALSDVAVQQVSWFVNDRLVGTSDQRSYPWKLSRGEFTTHAEIVLRGSAKKLRTPKVSYTVQ